MLNENASEQPKNLYKGNHSLNFDLRGDGILILRPQGPLTVQDFERLTALIDPWIGAHNQLRGVIVSLRKFPGWENFSSFVRHIQFVKEHHRLVYRVALIMDGILPELVKTLAGHFVQAEIKQFPYADEAQAIAWINS